MRTTWPLRVAVAALRLFAAERCVADSCPKFPPAGADEAHWASEYLVELNKPYDEKDFNHGMDAIAGLERAETDQARCVRTKALASAHRWRDINIPANLDCTKLTPPHVADPTEMSVDLRASGEITRIVIRNPDGHPPERTFVTHLAPTAYGLLRILKLTLRRGKYEVDYSTDCGSTTTTVRANTDDPAQWRLGFNVTPLLPPNGTLTIDGHPLVFPYFAAPGKHTVALKDRAECKATVDEDHPRIELPSACLGGGSFTLPWPGFFTMRTDMTKAGASDVVGNAGFFWRRPASGWSLDVPLGFLGSNTAMGFMGGLGATLYLPPQFEVAPTFEVFAGAIDIGPGPRVSAFGVHPSVQGRFRIAGGLGLVVTPGYFVIFGDRVRNATDASYWSLGGGLEWRSL